MTYLQTGKKDQPPYICKIFFDNLLVSSIEIEGRNQSRDLALNQTVNLREDLAIRNWPRPQESISKK